ncbi:MULTISPECIES: MFS transporter [unclassified Microbispora]|uniref:MFS transporter n=1 Tax=unclassified Microbispora TaxID=2614687 RepID=UPI00197C155B|nr:MULTISPECIES: MFS transporter [unclassified Microbispora]
MMMTFINITATIGSLGFIQSGLHTSTTTLVWVSSAYTLAVAGLTLSAGTLGDLAGRRTVFLIGTVVMGVGSLVAFGAGDGGTLIAAEAVMGVGGAMILPNSLTIVSHIFPDPRKRTEAISIWAGCSGVGLAGGPLVAGVLLNHFSWHSVFLVNAAMSLVVLAVTPILVKNSRHLGRRIDIPGLVLTTVSLLALTYGVIEGGHVGYGDMRILVAFLVFLVTLVLFVRVELRSADPMLNLTLFRSASFSTVMGVALVMMFGFGGVPLLMVLYFQRVQHASALDTGWRLLPMFAVYVAVSAVAGRLIRRFGTRSMLTAGLVIAAAGTELLMASPPDDSYAWVWPGMVLFGLGAGFVLAPSTAASISSVPHEAAGMASASVNMFRQLGNVLGASVLGTILTAHFSAVLPERLAGAGVPSGVAAQVESAVAHGGHAPAGAGAMGATIARGVAGAFTDSLRPGLIVTVCALVLAAVLTFVLFAEKSAGHRK